MDLSQFDTAAKAAEGKFLHLEAPDSTKVLKTPEGKPIGLTLIGADSKEYQRHRHKAIDARASRTRIGTRGKIKNFSSEESENEDVVLLAHAVKGFTNITVDGKAWEFSFDNAVALFERFPWIRSQADEFVHDRNVFLGES